MSSAPARRVPRPTGRVGSVPPAPQSDVRELAPRGAVEPTPEDNATQELDASQIEEAYAIVSRSAPPLPQRPLPASESRTWPSALLAARSAVILSAYVVFYFAGSLARRMARLLASEWQEACRRARLRRGDLSE